MMKRIKIIGVGCGGVNIVKYLYVKNKERFSFAAVDFDGGTLKKLPGIVTVHLRQNESDIGNNNEKKLKAVNEGSREIFGLFDDNPEIVMVVACLGGRSGSVATPVIANTAKKLGLVTMAVVTTPFRMEGLNKYERAIDSIREMAKDVNNLYVINNELAFQSLLSLTMMEAFERVDVMAEDAIISMIDMYYKDMDMELKATGRPNILVKLWRRLFSRKTNSQVEKY